MDYLSQEIETQHLVAAGWDWSYLEATVPNRQMLKPSLSTLFQKAFHWRCSSELLPHQNVVLRHTHEDETEKGKKLPNLLNFTILFDNYVQYPLPYSSCWKTKIPATSAIPSWLSVPHLIFLCLRRWGSCHVSGFVQSGYVQSKCSRLAPRYPRWGVR